MITRCPRCNGFLAVDGWDKDGRRVCLNCGRSVLAPGGSDGVGVKGGGGSEPPGAGHG